MELMGKKKEKNKLSKLTYRLRGMPDHPIYLEHKAATHNLKNCIETTKKKHWISSLEETTNNNIYLANKYINGEPSDYSHMHIPNIKTYNEPTHSTTLATDNANKVNAMAKTFFPPPLPVPSIPHSVYPEPLPAKGIFSKANIRNSIKNLKPQKTPGLDGIKNIILKECVDMVIDNLYHIFHTIVKLKLTG